MRLKMTNDLAILQNIVNLANQFTETLKDLSDLLTKNNESWEWNDSWTIDNADSVKEKYNALIKANSDIAEAVKMYGAEETSDDLISELKRRCGVCHMFVLNLSNSLSTDNKDNKKVMEGIRFNYDEFVDNIALVINKLKSKGMTVSFEIPKKITPPKKKSLTNFIRESAALGGANIYGDIGSFCVTQPALDEFFNIGEKLEFWHVCSPAKVKDLHDNEGGTANGYLFVDFMQKYMNEASGEMAVVKCTGNIVKDKMFDGVSRKVGNYKLNNDVVGCVELNIVSFDLDRKKSDFICEKFNKKDILAEFNEKYNDMPKTDFSVADMEFLDNYWNDSSFKSFIYCKFGNDLLRELLVMGHQTLMVNAKAIRKQFTSEPIVAENYKMLELYATPNTRRWFENHLPHFKVSYLYPKGFNLLNNMILREALDVPPEPPYAEVRNIDQNQENVEEKKSMIDFFNAFLHKANNAQIELFKKVMENPSIEAIRSILNIPYLPQMMRDAKQKEADEWNSEDIREFCKKASQKYKVQFYQCLQMEQEIRVKEQN